MKKKLLALLMGTSLVLAACGGGDEAKDKPAEGGTTTTADAGDAAKLYENKCSSCHGQNLEGGVGPSLEKVGGKLDQAGIEKIITEGKGAMPAGLLQGEEASKVASWLAEKK
ncbi:cytochrome c551 [Peribacillus tepidiphilus]|uniref:cytochrome c551 n=1 Tax=Peribacillus tepidiphilus TaxID=2652445 RepID=UPI001292977B|nr:cytochrome c [Peribacillus tepidiphilus]